MKKLVHRKTVHHKVITMFYLYVVICGSLDVANIQITCLLYVSREISVAQKNPCNSKICASQGFHYIYLFISNFLDPIKKTTVKVTTARGGVSRGPIVYYHLFIFVSIQNRCLRKSIFKVHSTLNWTRLACRVVKHCSFENTVHIY